MKFAVRYGNPGFVDLLWHPAKMNRKNQLTQIFKATFFFGLTCFWVVFQCHSQGLLLDDKIAMDSMTKAVDHVYNFQFDKANHSISKFKTRYQNHPGFLLFNSITQFWKSFPISSKPKEYSVYLQNLNKVIANGEKLAEKYPKSPEPTYYIMMANLILARHHSEEGEYIKAVNETRKAYSYIKKGFDLKTSYPEFYFSTGLYNYYRVAFPINHPFYNSFTVFFPEGNKVSGIKDLEIASQKSLFSKAESYIFLTTIHMRDEYNMPLSLKYSTSLHENYPGNWLFSIVYAECLIESKKGEAAEPLINRLLGRNEAAALLAGYYLKGLLEAQQGNSDGAKWAFQKALLHGGGKDRLTKGFIGLTYNELGKIAKEEGKLDWAKKYFKKALDNCSYKKVKKDAKVAGY